MALTRKKLAEDLVETLKINKQVAENLVEMFFREISLLLEQGQQLSLSGFGNFNLRDKKERQGRNPRTGKAFPVTARRVVTFRAGQKLKARVEKIEKVVKYAGAEAIKSRARAVKSKYVQKGPS